jgi:tetratricopeptide (TPR) repeat protein
MIGTEQKNRLALVCLVLALVTAAVYWPVHGYEFVSYDDNNYVTANPHVQSGLSGQTVLWAFTTYKENSTCWHPLTWLSHMLDCECFGLDAGMHHLTSVALHAANAILLFLLLRGMTGAFWRSAVVAALFAWHPLQVDSVAWIAERKNVLSTLFLMLTLLAYARYACGPSLGRYLLVFLFLCLGLMAKPSLVVAPFLLLVLDYWPLGRLQLHAWPSVPARSGSRDAPRMPQISLSRLVLEKLPLLLPVLFVCVITVLSQSSVHVLPSLKELPLSTRVANAFVSYLRYTGKALWPAHLAVFYPYPRAWPLWLVGAAVVFIVVVTALAVKWAVSHPWFLAGWVWFLAGIFPSIGLFQASNQSMADRYAYFALIGLFVTAVWGLPECLARWSQRDVVLPAVAAAALLAALTVTGFQLQCWHDTTTLFEHAFRVTGSATAQAALGNFYEHQDKLPEAVQHYSAALRADTGSLGASNLVAATENALGSVLVKQDKVDQAVPHFLRGLGLEPSSAIRCNLADAYFRQGKVEEAIDQYKTVLREDQANARACHDLAWLFATTDNAKYRDPAQAVEFARRSVALTEEKKPECWMTLAMACAGANRTNDAINAVRKTVELQAADTRQNPRELLPAALASFGLDLARRGQTDIGIALLAEAARLVPKPDDRAEMLRQLGLIFSQQGKYEQAASFYTAALESNPRYAIAHDDLGLDLVNRGDLPAALEHFAQAIKIAPDYAEAHRNMALALIAAGRLSEARSHLYETLRLKPDDVDALNDLAWLLATARDAKVRDAHEALRLAQHAAGLTQQKDAGVLETLAAAYAEGGNFPDAISTAEGALKLCDAQSQKETLEALQHCLQFMRAGKPVRQ